MLYFDQIRRRSSFEPEEKFPWTVAALRRLEELNFTTPVTFLVGDNGSGKSTLLEGLAFGMGAYAVGSFDQLGDDPLLAHAKTIADGFYFVRRQRARAKMFFRAEDMLGYIKAAIARAAAFEAEAMEGGASFTAANMLEAMAAAIRAAEPDGRSHGEAFIQMLERRLHGGGLYFLDEPETPLSPARQVALLHLIRERAAAGGQFIIATHSPILLALPGATIFYIGEDGVKPIAYEEVENVAVMKAFLRDPEAFLAIWNSDE